jgi:hypothetical protein
MTNRNVHCMSSHNIIIRSPMILIYTPPFLNDRNILCSLNIMYIICNIIVAYNDLCVLSICSIFITLSVTMIIIVTVYPKITNTMIDIVLEIKQEKQIGNDIRILMNVSVLIIGMCLVFVKAIGETNMVMLIITLLSILGFVCSLILTHSHYSITVMKKIPGIVKLMMNLPVNHVKMVPLYVTCIFCSILIVMNPVVMIFILGIMSTIVMRYM